MIHTQTRKYIPVLSTGLGYRHKPHALRPASKRARKGKKQGKRKEKKRMKEGQGSRSAKLYASCILHPFIPSGRPLPQHHHHRRYWEPYVSSLLSISETQVVIARHGIVVHHATIKKGGSLYRHRPTSLCNRTSFSMSRK